MKRFLVGLGMVLALQAASPVGAQPRRAAPSGNLNRGIVIIPGPKQQTLDSNPVPPSAVGNLNYNETTGIINVPSARVAPAGSFERSIEWQDTTFPGTGLYTSKSDGLRELDFANSLFQNAGDTRYIWGVGHNIELSAMSRHFGLDFSAITFGGKWLAVPDDENHPAFAVGVQSINLKAEDGVHSQYTYAHPAFFDKPSVFAVVGHTFALDDAGESLELAAGWGTGRLSKGFIGTELHFNKYLGVAADYDGTIESFALKVFPTDRFTVVFDVQAQVPYRFGASFRYTMGAAAQRGAPEWARKRDRSHVPQPDIQLIKQTDHLAEMFGAPPPP